MTTDELELPSVPSNIGYVATSWANLDWTDLQFHEDTKPEIFKQILTSEVNPPSPGSSSTSLHIVPAPPTPNPPTPESLSCDWPSCTRTLPTKSAYK